MADSFNGATSYIEVPAHPELDLNVFTVSSWFKSNDTTVAGALVAHGESNDTDKLQYSLFQAYIGTAHAWFEASNDADNP